MKYFINILFLLIGVSLSAQSGYLKPKYIGWPVSTTQMQSLVWDPAVQHAKWAITDGTGGGQDSIFIQNDSLCAVSMGDTICVSADSVFISSDSVCVIQGGDTTCLMVPSIPVTIYSGDGIVAGNRGIETAGHTIEFDRVGIPVLKIFDTGNLNSTEIGISQTFRGSGTLGLKNFGTGDIFEHFDGSGSDEDYCIGTNKVDNCLSFAEGDDIGGVSGVPFMRYYGGGDTLLISKNTIFRNNSLTGQSQVKIYSTNTGAASSVQKSLDILLTGANGTPGQSTYGSYVSNSHTGTNPHNYGYYSTVTGTLSTGLSANSNLGTAIEGISGGVGIYGSSTTTSQNLYSLIGEKNTSSTNNIIRPLLLSTISSGGAGANGIGTGLDFAMEPTTGGVAVLANSITSSFTDAVIASKTSKLVINGFYNGSQSDIIQLGNTSLGRAGEILLNGYANTQDDGYATNVLGTATDGTLTSSPVRKIYTNSVTGNSTLTLSTSGFYVNTSGGPTWSLPTVAASQVGVIYWIKNKSASALTINVVGGGSTITDIGATGTSTSVSVASGVAVMIECDGVTWNLQ